MARLLVVDDDLSMREFLELMLTGEGYEVDLAGGGEEALAKAAENRYDLVITDIRMKNTGGIEVLKGVKALSPETVVILISAFATAETAVVAMKEGAYDFIPKPFNLEELKTVVQNALAYRTPEDERRTLKAKVQEGCHFGALVGTSPEMLKVYDLIRRAAKTTTNILISGESGTGKELVARAIHDNGPRAGEKFVAVNCGGMPEQLIESELFGHKKGAFTGAASDKQGLFEIADKGTLFLDELAELSLPMQVKLLRVVQEKTFRAVGGTSEKRADVRLIAATNKDLEAEVMNGNFREDLYYRINVINIHMPSLRERKTDVPLLAQYFLEKYSRTMGKDVRKISAYALDILSNYDFPGNVRELENIIERSVALEESSIVLPESLTLASFKHERRLNQTQDSEPDPLPPETASPLTTPPLAGLDDILAALETRYLLFALHASEGVRYKTAELLGVSAWRLRNKLADQGLDDIDQQEVEKRIAQSPETIPGVPPEIMPKWTPQGFKLDAELLEVEHFLLRQALNKARGSKTKAAELLGISPRTFSSRLLKHESQ